MNTMPIRQVPSRLIQQMLRDHRREWDHPEFRPTARRNFEKVVSCGTAALGSRLYASESETKIVHHTCKSGSCVSCGQAARINWQRQRFAALPNVPFGTLVFTMPDVLWPIYQQNRHLVHDLPTLAGAVIQQWAAAEYGVEVMSVVVTHTFGGRLNFHPHLHVLASAAGWCRARACWVESIELNASKLMYRWRHAVVQHLRAALRESCLETEVPSPDLRRLLNTQYGRRWNVYVKKRISKVEFLSYAGRYFRRPPLAQRRILEVRAESVIVELKDRKARQQVPTEFRTGDLIRLLGEHVPEHYKHSVRYFGLLAPRAINKRMAGVFVALNQARPPRPARLSWAYLLKREFNVDPLVDSNGHRMRLVSSRFPAPS